MPGAAASYLYTSVTSLPACGSLVHERLDISRVVLHYICILSLRLCFLCLSYSLVHCVKGTGFGFVCQFYKTFISFLRNVIVISSSGELFKNLKWLQRKVQNMWWSKYWQDNSFLDTKIGSTLKILILGFLFVCLFVLSLLGRTLGFSVSFSSFMLPWIYLPLLIYNGMTVST